MWQLIGVQGVYSGRFFDLDKDSITIGKDSGCAVNLGEDQAIADNQAEILLCNGSYVFRDLGGACPTMINGTVSAGMVTLNHGDMVQIGESIFRVEHIGSQTSPRSASGTMKSITGSESPRQKLPWNLRREHITVFVLLVVVVSTLGVFAARKLAHSTSSTDSANTSRIQSGPADLVANMERYEDLLQQCELLDSQIEDAKNDAAQHNDRQSQAELSIAIGALDNAIRCQKRIEDKIPELSSLLKMILLHPQFSACYQKGEYVRGYLNECEPMRFRHFIAR